MKELKFSNADVKKIVDTVTKKKAWEYKVSSIDGKIEWVIKNNPSKSKIDVFAGGKYIDDYKYDTTEKDDVYATILNVLDYLTNILNKYNKRNPKAIKEDEITESEINSLSDAEIKVLKILRNGRAYGKGGLPKGQVKKNVQSTIKTLMDKGCLEYTTHKGEELIIFTTKGRNLVGAILEYSNLKITAAASEITEAMSKGMMRAYSKRVKEGDAHYTCKSCNTNIPKYRGRYPAKCPSCGESIKLMKEKDHEIGVVASYQRGSTVVVKLTDPDDFYNAKINAYRPDNNSYAIEIIDGPAAGKVVQNVTPAMIKKV